MTTSGAPIIRNRDLGGVPSDTRFGVHRRTDFDGASLEQQFPWSVIVRPGQSVPEAAIAKLVSATQEVFPDARQISVSRDHEGFATVDAVTGQGGIPIWLDGDGTNELYQSLAHDAGDLTDLENSERRLVTIPELREPVGLRLQQIADDAGRSGIMPAVFSVICDRENISEAALRELGPDDLERFYVETVDDAIDEVVNAIRYDDGYSRADEDRDDDDDPSMDEVREHTTAICTEAGLGVMAAVFDVIIDREELDPADLLALDEDDVTRFYELNIGRAVDRIEEQLSEGEQEHPVVEEFLLSANQRHLNDGNERWMSWADLSTYLEEMPDASLAVASGSPDTTGTRDRLTTLIGLHTSDEPVPV